MPMKWPTQCNCSLEYFYVTMQQLSRVFSDTEKISQLENLNPIRQSRAAVTPSIFSLIFEIFKINGKFPHSKLGQVSRNKFFFCLVENMKNAQVFIQIILSQFLFCLYFPQVFGGVFYSIRNQKKLSSISFLQFRAIL